MQMFLHLNAFWGFGWIRIRFPQISIKSNYIFAAHNWKFSLFDSFFPMCTVQCAMCTMHFSNLSLELSVYVHKCSLLRPRAFPFVCFSHFNISCSHIGVNCRVYLFAMIECTLRACMCVRVCVCVNQLLLKKIENNHRLYWYRRVGAMCCYW